MYTKQALITTFILFIIFGGVTYYLLSREKQTPPPSEVITEEETEGTPLAPVSFKEEHVNEKYYRIDMVYPQSSSEQLPDIYAYVEKIKEDFMTSVPKSEADAEFIGLSDSGYQYVLNTTTKVYFSPKTITYVLTTYVATGGAHGSTIVGTFTYDGEGKKMVLKDLFKDENSFETLSTKARDYFYTKLGGTADGEWIETGTAPEEKNFSTWYINGETIIFVFQQYQVGPYVLGLQEFPLTKTEAGTFLNIE